MYQNRISLIGFLGKDAEQRSTNANGTYTILSIATKTSWKKDGEWQSRTEWHRAIVWGRLGEFAKTLTKGAHLQIEGELRSREYEKKQREVPRMGDPYRLYPQTRPRRTPSHR